jgi:hypothetical protein
MNHRPLLYPRKQSFSPSMSVCNDVALDWQMALLLLRKQTLTSLQQQQRLQLLLLQRCCGSMCTTARCVPTHEPE